MKLWSGEQQMMMTMKRPSLQVSVLRRGWVLSSRSCCRWERWQMASHSSHLGAAVGWVLHKGHHGSQDCLEGWFPHTAGLPAQSLPLPQAVLAWLRRTLLVACDGASSPRLCCLLGLGHWSCLTSGRLPWPLTQLRERIAPHHHHLHQLHHHLHFHHHCHLPPQ